ncbi:hypothetical protein MAR_033558 [Mya arenaria]|uniref:SGNH hydrolase-type esterase domain-containing protein n=1 Tax=Mya arenaria TaxID=6604 RepID=A0ABY7GIK5_MYAAR|nr:hypothetical protein MAR_033558 [Mya arenaria]
MIYLDSSASTWTPYPAHAEQRHFVFSYSGFTVREFQEKSLEFYELVPHKSISYTIALVVGANDIGRRSAAAIVRAIRQLCLTLHTMCPHGIILLSEILPRGRNLFHEQTGPRVAYETGFLDHWNAVASYNKYLCKQQEVRL